jgi:hypothetical protein
VSYVRGACGSVSVMSDIVLKCEYESGVCDGVGVCCLTGSAVLRHYVYLLDGQCYVTLSM